MKTMREYMLLSKGDRQSHLDLSALCVERGGNSTRFQGVLAEGLNTTIPNKKTDGVAVHLCHACHNASCSNVRHLYWGTPRENVQDNMANGTFKSAWAATVAKHGLDKSLEMARSHQKSICSAGGVASAEAKRR